MMTYPENDLYIETAQVETYSVDVDVPDVVLSTANDVDINIPVPAVSVDFTAEATAVLDLSELAIVIHEEMRYAGLLRFVDTADDVPWAATGTGHQMALDRVVKAIGEKLKIQLEIEQV